jgi:hypothetical protein
MRWPWRRRRKVEPEWQTNAIAIRDTDWTRHRRLEQDFIRPRTLIPLEPVKHLPEVIPVVQPEPYSATGIPGLRRFSPEEIARAQKALDVLNIAALDLLSLAKDGVRSGVPYKVSDRRAIKAAKKVLAGTENRRDVYERMRDTDPLTKDILALVGPVEPWAARFVEEYINAWSPARPVEPPTGLVQGHGINLRYLLALKRRQEAGEVLSPGDQALIDARPDLTISSIQSQLRVAGIPEERGEVGLTRDVVWFRLPDAEPPGIESG